MARRQFKIPFAATGDTVSIPETTQPDGSVSMQQGYGFDYQRDPQTDPLAKAFPRDVHNGLMNEITASIGEIQQNGFPIWVAEGAPYPINARVYYADKVWRSNVINNNGEPGVSSSWDDISEKAEDLLNSLRVDVASASTINLTTAAPNTRHINITGTTTINGFTVTAGQCYFVRFNGALTLTNGASLVTNRGANIAVAAGDTCVIRATAANTVEILCGDFLSEAALGARGQTWQNVTASRAANTLYTNTTGRPIVVKIITIATWPGSRSIMVNGVSVDYQEINSIWNGTMAQFAIVPAGATYQFGVAPVPVTQWMELR